MYFIKKLVPKLLLSICIALTATAVYAQTATTATKTVTSSNNLVVLLMGFISLILAFVIWGMGNVLVTLGKQLLNRNKQGQKILAAIMILGFSLLSLTSNAQAAPEVIKEVPNYGGMDSTGFWVLATVIFMETVIILFMMSFISRIQSELIIKEKKASFVGLKEWWSRMDKRLFTKAVPVEKEKDILLDHDYDGIKELDNALPPWWKYGFMITIVIAVIYLFNFHVMGYGKNPTEEYQVEIVKAQEAKAIYEAQNADKVDEANLKMPAAGEIASAKEIFNSVCWTCHGKLGEGGAGPNLTDDYWIHKGSLTDVYLSIKNGYPDKGMQSWQKNYSPKEMNNLAGYVLTLKGTNPPNPKAPQGDLFTETIIADSTTKTTTVTGSKDTIILITDSSRTKPSKK